MERLNTRNSFLQIAANSPKIHGFITIIVASVIFTVCFITFTTLGLLSRGTSTPIYYCYHQLLFPPKVNMAYSLGLLMPLIGTCLMMLYVKLKNQYLWATFGFGSTSHNLTQRFAISANISTAEWLIPISVFETMAAIFCAIWWSLAHMFYAGCLTTGFLSYVNVMTLFINVKYIISAVLMLR